MAATILSFPAPHKCLPGTLAFHPEYGVCEVIGASGAKRTVLYDERVPDLIPDTSDLGPDEDPESILFSETITIHEAEVDVNDLREEPGSPRDPMRQPLSRILGMNGRVSLSSWRPADACQRPQSMTQVRGAIQMDTLPVTTRCPVGALVHHPRHGVCEVVAVDGSMRTIEYEVREARVLEAKAVSPANCFQLRDGDDDWNESVSSYEAVVHADELRWLRARVDLAMKPGSRILSLKKSRA